MSFEIVAELHKKFDTENKTDSFQARDFVLKTDGQYPQFIKFQLTQDRCSLIDAFNENEKIKVYFDLRGREWNGKYFTNLNAWKVEKVESTPTTSTETGFEGMVEPIESESEEIDDLPF